jgi:DNA-binding PadR family transcriptional regulator
MSEKGSAVTPVILGLLSYAPMSGYDMKQAVERSTRFFWAASYGQIYPELRRLEAQGLIEGEDKPNGGRTRRVYRLTKTGRQALVDWLLGSTTGIELRDESLLRLFFSPALPREQALMLLEGRKRGHEHYLEILRALVPEDRPEATKPSLDNIVWRWGIEFNEWGIKWCEEELQRLRNEKKAA